jgi:hypothetical protein
MRCCNQIPGIKLIYIILRGSVFQIIDMIFFPSFKAVVASY